MQNKESADFSRSFWGKQVGKRYACLIFFATLVFLYPSHSFSSNLFQKIARIRHRIKPSKRLYYNKPDNFYEVDKNKFFRSKQLTGKRLRYYLERFGIKTIINLRGRNENAKWWKAETAVASALGVEVYDIAMSAKRLPYKIDLIVLLYLYETAERPILVHCLGGADRTGEAAAIWVMDQQSGTKKRALRQLSQKYSHISFTAPAKRFFVKIWEGREWALKSYDPTKYPRFYPRNT